VEPTVQVGLAVGAPGATLGGDAALVLSSPDGELLGEVPAGEVWKAAATNDGIALSTATGVRLTVVEQALVTPAAASAPVRVNGRLYHGTLALLRDRTGLTVVNQVPMEAYLLGVVSAEMGRRDPSEEEALRAQAIVSRTYALRNLGRWRGQGFDLYATVSDQVYAGVGSETPEGRDAVEATRGQVLLWNGSPIDAFFFSTCGGRTADGGEVFRGADRPYLRSVSDVGPDGVAYCSISPRFRWRQEWTGAELRTVLRKWLPSASGVSTERISEVREVTVLRRTASGRVGQLGIQLAREDVTIDGPQVRQVLRNTQGDILRSTGFTLTATHSGGRISRLVAEGSGNGHGVGLCQWGAVGRARAGQGYAQILAAYYPSTDLTRMY
jgi:stage II sporulation protein D